MLIVCSKWKAWTATVATILLAASFGVMEVILIFTLQVSAPRHPLFGVLTQLRQGPYDRGIKWPMMLMAISATLIQIAGLIPPYFELAKRNGRVIGIGTHTNCAGGDTANTHRFLVLTHRLRRGFLLTYGTRSVLCPLTRDLYRLFKTVAQQWFDSLGGSLYIAW